MQGVADEPADGDVDVSLTQELAIVHDPEQQPGEHQSYGNFGIDPRPAITMAIAIDDFLPKPGKIDHAADPSQHVIIGDELAERARDEQLQLIPFLPPQHVAPLHPQIVGNTESVFSNFFNDPTMQRCQRACGKGKHQDRQDQAQKDAEPDGDAPEVVCGGGEDGVCGIAGMALEVAASEVTFFLHVADEGFDGGSAAQLSFDRTEDVTLLAGDEDAARLGRVVPAISLVDVDPFDLATGKALVSSMAARKVWPS
jgi:hypothetical protein